MINDTIRKKLRLSEDKVPTTLYDYGNTSSASIPLTMSVRAADRIRQDKSTVLLSGFGVGLSWASAILHIDRAVMSPIVEI
jgi:3-oxoacyl-[acyl-carrier-protein] synthase-3